MAENAFPRIEPMHPWRARAPFHRDGWVFERKDDGWRMLGFKRGSSVRLVSRRGVDHTARFPELAAALSRLPAPTLILDGEVCVFDANLISQFHLLGEDGPDELATPPVYVAFDCLWSRGRDLRRCRLSDRRAALEEEIAGAQLVYPSLRLDGDGFAAWAEVKRCGWEGLVAKDEGSPYVAGRSRSWVKVKVRREGRFAVVGVDASDGASSLLVAGRRRGRLGYVGRVEWGVTRAAVASLLDHTATRMVPPCLDAERTRGVVWLAPGVVAEVTYSELMLGRLRDPVLRPLHFPGGRRRS